MANSFNKMIDDKIIKRGKTGFLIQLGNIHVNPEFDIRVKNERYHEAGEKLYQFMLAGGKVPPLEVIPRDDGGVWIIEGHRRNENFHRLLNEAGRPVDWIRIDPFEGNNIERIARVRTSNNQLPITDYEEALLVRDLQNLNLTADKIAEVLHIPRYKVDNALVLLSANYDVHQLVEEGTVDIPLAVERVKKHGEKAGELLKDDVAKAQKKGKPKATKSTAIPQFSATKSRNVLKVLAQAEVREIDGQTAYVLPAGTQLDVLAILDEYRAANTQEEA
ncbi:chromosome partitioning protein ParB [Serratia marcescens]|uniref:chromosome partitioning protein ParB n=1 Tax=Serratia nevei TaxID=2703794 RepID=UPI001A29EE57|nr:chromosome partitioning protein ParB [Serratia marcescens]ELQ9441946.1 chromosome partitioning protein ParB [Serratia marcescens]ELT5562472.1 chromosome partitioning protein ParB [Serratia marcescens]HAT4993763.1 chromosome partitioning protein ParB [Serratia marcescens]